MAQQYSLNTDKKSPYWMVSFLGSDGKQKRRSTKVPVEGGMYKGKKLSRERAQKEAAIVAAIIVNAEHAKKVALEDETVRMVFARILSGEHRRMAPPFYKDAALVYRKFCEFIGDRADKPLRLISKGDITDFVAARRKEVRAGTVTRNLAYLKVAFGWAEDADIIQRNPTRGIVIPKDTAAEKLRREAFTMDEIKLLVGKLPDEWSAAVRCSFELYGLRLSDTLNLRWNQFDWTERVVRLTTGKTARLMQQPMRESFFRWAQERFAASGNDENGYVCGNLRSKSDASRKFRKLVEAQGIGKRYGITDGRRHSMASKTFHCIRSTCATLLHMAGVSENIAMELVGHNSLTVHSVYVRPLPEHLRQSAEKIPEL